MSKGLYTYPLIASLGIAPYTLDLKGTLGTEFTYSRATEDEVTGPNGEVIQRAVNQYIPDYQDGLNIGMRFTPGEDQLLWQPTPGVYTLFIEHGDMSVDVRTVLVEPEGIAIIPSLGKTHIRRIGVNREPELETPTDPDGGQLPLVSLPTELVVAEGETLSIAVSKLGTGACTVSISASSGVA